MIFVTIPLKTVSEANSHEHWRARQKRAKGQRDAAGLFVLGESQRRNGYHSSWILNGGPEGTRLHNLVVTITRLSARQLDSDNLASSQKHVRDGVADALGIDDRDPRVRWEYAQEKAKGFAVRIEIRRAG